MGHRVIGHLSPVVHGDIALTINTNTIVKYFIVQAFQVLLINSSGVKHLPVKVQYIQM